MTILNSFDKIIAEPIAIGAENRMENLTEIIVAKNGPTNQIENKIRVSRCSLRLM